jgi:hypothetical protein
MRLFLFWPNRRLGLPGSRSNDLPSFLDDPGRELDDLAGRSFEPHLRAQLSSSYSAAQTRFLEFFCWDLARRKPHLSVQEKTQATSGLAASLSLPSFAGGNTKWVARMPPVSPV